MIRELFPAGRHPNQTPLALTPPLSPAPVGWYNNGRPAFLNMIPRLLHNIPTKTA